MKIINYLIDENEYLLNSLRLERMLKEELINKNKKYLEYAKWIKDEKELLNESLLYYYIYEKNCTYSLEQIIGGYFNLDHPEKISFEPTKDINGTIYIPNKGYIDENINLLNNENLVFLMKIRKEYLLKSLLLLRIHLSNY